MLVVLPYPRMENLLSSQDHYRLRQLRYKYNEGNAWIKYEQTT